MLRAIKYGNWISVNERTQNMNMMRAIVVSGLMLIMLFITACGTVTGATVGAGAGAAVGAGTGHGAKKGALIGAGIGAAAGAIYDITKK
jgi:hypothetical protein